MNDQDYIRKAVELADGWRLSSSILWGPDRLQAPVTNQAMLDALAAHLVRQVDALDGLWVEIDNMGAGIYTINDWGNKAIVFASEESDDRTMNTLKE